MSSAICPLSLVGLRSKPQDVVGLVCNGKRVEAALYLRPNVIDEDGIFTLRYSPVSGVPVDGFVKMPQMPVKGASALEWEAFMEFFHWHRNDDGWFFVAEVAVAFAATMPVDERAVERFIRSHFDVDCDGHIQREELLQQVLPYLSQHLDDLQDFAPARELPPIARNSTRVELLRWFDFWDCDGCGEIDRADFYFAVAMTLYQALGPSVTQETKEAVVSVFLVETLGSGVGHVTRARFTDIIGPTLQANLPEAPHDICTRGSLPPVQLIVEDQGGKRIEIEVSGDSTIASLREAAWLKLNDRKQLKFRDRLLDDDMLPISAVMGLSNGVVIQVVPEEIFGCHIC